MQASQKSSRLFENDFLESLTHVHHNTPLFLYTPVIVLSIFFGFKMTAASVAGGVGLIVFGFLNWTLFEYWMHRFLFHYQPKTKMGERFVYLFHGIHHDFPNEKDRLVMPTLTSIAIGLVVFALHYGLAGPKGLFLYAGFLVGYLYYEFVHYAVHNRKIKFGWTEWQRKNHLKHHFQDSENRFGVSTPLWDYVFRTYR
ncbi:MAG: sterol desaturase family protein [Deltaproteobacteria bacterium]|nr:sterol desaturase family protein [Deltaproteobacteria bacterium]